MKTIKYTLFLIAVILSYSCSDNPTGQDEVDGKLGKGVLNVTGDLQLKHEGVSEYIGFRDLNGDFTSISLFIKEFSISSEEESDFSFDILMVGVDEPFTLKTGNYQLSNSGEANSGEVAVVSSYTNINVSSSGLPIYSSFDDNSSGTVTIVSIGSETIKATFNVNLVSTNGENSVNISGELNASCVTAIIGFGC